MITENGVEVYYFRSTVQSRFFGFQFLLVFKKHLSYFLTVIMHFSCLVELIGFCHSFEFFLVWPSNNWLIADKKKWIAYIWFMSIARLLLFRDRLQDGRRDEVWPSDHVGVF